MSPNELKQTLTAKGYVLASDGSFYRPDSPRTKADPGAQEPPPEGQRGPEPTAGAEYAHAIVQKLEAMDNQTTQRQAAETSTPDYLPGVSGMDGEGSPEFRITVTLFVSNRVRRDPTGAFETICDVIKATRRRLSERLSGGVMEGRARARRRRRVQNRDRTTSVTAKGPVPF